ncbi:hypothetical protein SALBM311S_06783 [Streptomyces alboniger]
MEVHGGRHQDVRADHFADAVQEFGLGVVQVLDGHRAVDVVPEAVDRAQLAEPVEEIGGQFGVRGSRHRAAGQGLADEGAAPVGGLTQGLSGGEEGVAGEDVRTAVRVEGRGLGTGRGEGRGLDAESGDRDDGQGHGSSGA